MKKIHKPDRKLRGKLFLFFVNNFGKLWERKAGGAARLLFLMKRAQKETSLKDFGDDDYITPLKVLMKSFDEESKHKPFMAKASFYEKIFHLLRNRLFIQEELKQHPEVKNEKIRQPLFIVSLPRTGTTVLQRLLCQDPTNKGLYLWEALIPVPPPEKSGIRPDFQKYIARRYLQAIDTFARELKTKHPMSVDSYEECFYLLENTFVCRSFLFEGKLERYKEWLEKSDYDDKAYQYHKLILQMLQRRNQCERWILKSPFHLFTLDALLKTYPDACIVQTHRDLASVVPSAGSLLASINGMFNKNLVLSELMEYLLESYDLSLKRYINIRDKHDQKNFFDIDFSNLIKDPISIVKRIYEHFGFEYTPEFEQKMRDWLKNNPRHKHGMHKYCLEDFGLNEKNLRSRYDYYYERFNFKRNAS